MLDALAPQVDADVEVLVLESSSAPAARELQRRYAWVRVISLPQRTLPGRARNLGIELSTGSLLAFLDADAVPAPEWLPNLRRGLAERPYAAVGGAILNGTPHSGIGTTFHLLEFLDWSPEAASAPRHAASCNLIVRRTALLSAGGFREDVWPGEDTILTYPWGEAGALGFVDDARVWHLNRTRLRELLAHQYRLGAAFVAVCDHVAIPSRVFSRWPLLAAAPAARLLSLWLRLRGQPRARAEAIMISPLLAAGLVAWGAGAATARRRSTLRSPPLTAD